MSTKPVDYNCFFRRPLLTLLICVMVWGIASLLMIFITNKVMDAHSWEGFWACWIFGSGAIFILLGVSRVLLRMNFKFLFLWVMTPGITNAMNYLGSALHEKKLLLAETLVIWKGINSYLWALWALCLVVSACIGWFRYFFVEKCNCSANEKSPTP